jgi:hypothetical protein
MESRPAREEPTAVDTTVRKEVAWIVDDAYNFENFEQYGREARLHEYRHKASGLILGQCAVLMTPPTGWLKWFKSPETLATTDAERNLLTAARNLLAKTRARIEAQQKLDEATAALKKAFANKVEDQRMIEQKVKEL